MTIAAGKTIPSFTLPDQHGKPVSSAALLRDSGGLLVLYFYPKADTSSCTKEACAFNEALPALGKLGVTVVGVSPDPSKDLLKFAKKFGLGFTLLGDVPVGEGKAAVPKVIDAFGVWGEKSMYGNTYMGVIRTTLLVDAKGKVLSVWENVKVTGHVDEVSGMIAALTGGGGEAEQKAAKKTPKKKAVKKKAVKKK